STTLVASSSLVSQWDIGAATKAWKLGVATDTSKFTVYISNAGDDLIATTKEYTSSISVFDNSWHLIGFSFNGGTLKLYIDGVEDTTVATTKDGAVPTMFDSSNNITIAASSSGGSQAEFYLGYLDEIAFYRSSLNVGHINTVYNSGVPIDLVTTGPAAGQLDMWWRMGDDSGDDIGTTNTITELRNAHHGSVLNMSSADIENIAP
ncbi:MAG: hypothetical protein HON90_10265, partial [Halobacteriovoraceae bacterium]|nr:hypothetical protein [Halobacteriovoraceae bacterium]